MIIGAGGVGRVVAFKCAQDPEVFSEILLASRTVSKCDRIADDIKIQLGYNAMSTARVDADNVPELVKLINLFKKNKSGSNGEQPCSNSRMSRVRRLLRTVMWSSRPS